MELNAKKYKIKFSPKEKQKINKQAHRKAVIETGQYGIPTHKVHKNKRKYDRKRDKKTKEWKR